MPTTNKLYASSAVLLNDEVIKSLEPTPERAIDILSALQTESHKKKLPMTVAILENSHIGNYLMSTVQTCERCKSTASEDDKVQWDRAISIAESLISSYKHAAEVELQHESDDELTLDGTVSGSDEEEEDDNDESSTHSDYEECPLLDDYEEEDYGGDDTIAVIDGGDIIIDNYTKMDIFAPALYWLDIMMKNDDVSPAITKRIGIIYESQYKKVIALIKSVLPSSTEEETSEPNTTFVSVSSFNNEQVAQLDVLCQETAQLILEEFTGYTGDLLESIELMLGGRVSTGTEGCNDGRSQGAKLLAMIKLLNEKKFFKLPVVLNQRFMLAIGYNRKHPERCDAIYEVIKATLFSSYRGIHLFLNDSLRMFYGSVQHRYLYGVLKALNPKRDIDISFGSHGLMPTKGNELVIDTINTCQHQYKILGKEISHKSASSCVPVDPKSTDPPQDEIDTKAEELYLAWDKARQIPQKYKDAIARGKEYAIDDNERRLTKRDYRAAVKNSKYRLKDLRFEQLTPNDRDKLKDLDFDQLTLHDRSQTEKGSSILQEESDGYFGLQSDDQASSVDIAALLRTSTMNKQTTGMKGHLGSLHLDGVPIDQLASIVACIEVRKKHELLPENAELKFIFYERGSKRVTIMTEDYCKLVHMTKSRGIGYIFTANLNRINSESIAVQMILEVERIIPEFQVIPTRESGKKRLSVIAKEDERVHRYQGISGVCKSKVNGIEQSFEEVKSNPTLDKAVKDICGRRMGNKFQEDVAVVHAKNTSYPPFPIPYSNIDPQCMERIVTLNEQGKPKSKWVSTRKEYTSRMENDQNLKRHLELLHLQLQKQLEKVSFPFQVQMPAGVVEGQQVQVPHPQAGHTLVFAIPAGVKPGAIFNVSRESILRVHMKANNS